MTSKQMRENALFTRNSFETIGKWEYPMIRKQEIPLDGVRLVACSDTRAKDRDENKECGVHFFVDDWRFEGIYRNPEKTLSRYSQYAFLLTPDFSLNADMPLWKQVENVGKNRWVGAYWQNKGLSVIPTIAWSTARSFEFCFDAVEKQSTLAVGMVGCKGNKIGFMRGYNEMLTRLEPENIIVFGTPFPEMEGNIISVDYMSSRKVVR